MQIGCNTSNVQKLTWGCKVNLPNRRYG